jgi:hypothetical protein
MNYCTDKLEEGTLRKVRSTDFKYSSLSKLEEVQKISTRYNEIQFLSSQTEFQ